VELYDFLRGTLAWTVSVAALWPLNIPLAVLAYRIHRGPRPVDMEPKELWIRATFASLLVALLTLAMVFIDYLLAFGADFPAGPIHLAVLLGYVPIAMWIFFVFFALDDLLPALGLFMLYVYLPVTVLYLLNLVVGFWQPLVNAAASWLKVPTA
jgi:hypothetical protein